MLQEVCRDVRLVTDSLNFVREVANVIRESSKRGSLFESMFEQGEAKRLLSLCPTRWCVRVTSVKRLKESYEQVLNTLSELSEDRSVRGENRAKIAGLLNIAGLAKTYFGILVCITVFSPCETVAKKLQGVGVTAQGAMESVLILLDHLRGLRTDDNARKLYQDMLTSAERLQLKMLPQRLSKTPKRYRHTEEEEDIGTHTETLEDSLRRKYFEVLDLVIQLLEKRFDQPGMHIAAQRERSLLQATQTVVSASQLKLPSDIDEERLNAQLLLLPNLCDQKNKHRYHIT